MHAETLGRAPANGRLRGRRVLVIGAGQRDIPEQDPPIGNGRAIPVLFAREAQQSAAAWDDECAVNVRSHMLFAQAGLDVMAPGSSIVLMSSLSAHRNTGRNPAYESSKAAQVALARAIAVAGEAKAIRCNAVCPD